MESVQVESTVTEADNSPEPSRVAQAAEVLEVEVEAEVDPEAEVAPEPEPEAEAEAEAELAPEEKPVSVGKEYRALRKRKRQIEKREQDFASKMETFEQQQAKLEQGLEIVRLMQENPEEAFSKFAELSGGNTDEFYERLTTQRLTGGEAPEESPAMREVKLLRQELAEKEKLTSEREASFREEQQATAAQGEIDGYVKEMCSIPDVPEFSEKWPNLAALRPDILESRTRYAVLWAIENAPQTKLPELADALDSVVGEEYNFVLGKLNGSRGSGNPSEEVKPEGLGKPAEAKPKSLTLTNDDAAVSGRKMRDMTREDRLKAAASALPDLVAMLNN